jgi:hypothetical protein
MKTYTTTGGTMQTRREYLVGLGLAKEGRGKLSTAAHAAIAKAVAEGMQFSDLQDRPVVVKRESKPKDNETSSDDNRFAAAAMRYPLDQKFKGEDSHGKTFTVSARSACGNSRYSIAGCFTCQTHTALVNSMEFINVSPIGE